MDTILKNNMRQGTERPTCILSLLLFDFNFKRFKIVSNIWKMVPMSSRPGLIEAAQNLTHILWNVSKFLDQTANREKKRRKDRIIFMSSTNTKLYPIIIMLTSFSSISK